MASIYGGDSKAQPFLAGRLDDPAFTIGSPRFDMLFFWGAPLIALATVGFWLISAAFLPHWLGATLAGALFAGVAVLTYAHLVAVVPRAYFNREVFQSNSRRLILVPAVLFVSLLVSPTLLVCAAVVAFFWDVHHSAMQNFGLSRIYDMKAGNKPLELRSTDLRLNWALYVGPIAAGASLFSHVAEFGRFDDLHWSMLTSIPGFVQGHSLGIRLLAVAAWIVTIGWAVFDYSRASRRGYRLPAPKAALLFGTASVSIAAWGFAPPVVAFAIINLFHAVQYFALVWLKEGSRMREQTGKLLSRSGDTAPGAAPVAAALLLFLALCAAFGIIYYLSAETRLLVAPFIACSLLHFWFDSFVWSVRKKQV